MGSIGILFLIAIYGALHSALASQTAKAQARQWFGPAADRWYRLAYNLFAVLSFLPIPALVIALPDRTLYFVTEPAACFTLAFQFFALVGMAAGVLQTGALSFSGLRQLFAPQPGAPRLVTTGLYRYVRHPIYTAALVFLWLTPVMTLNILLMNIGLTAYFLIGARYEERRLAAEFDAADLGAAYQQYRQKTPMLIPGLKRCL